ncbi:MAG: hypothetical protein ACT452_16795 [Microthrixaceae bacterium]
MTNSHRARRPLAVAALVFVAGAALSVVGSAVSQPAQAREFEPLVLTVDKPVFATFPAIPESLVYQRKPDPDFCRGAAYCDTIPVKIPTPDLPPGSGYTLVFKAANVDGIDGSEINVFFWDDTQLKQKFGKCPPGETCYDPLESDYTDILSITNPHNGGPTGDGVYTVGEPDLIDYNITILNYNGVNSGYTIYLELVVEDFIPPDEVRPPDNNTVSTPSGTRTFTTTDVVEGRTVEDPVTGEPSDLPPSLNDLLIERDPDLQAIRDQNLADQLKAPPSQIAARGRVESAPPGPVSGLTLLLWLAVMPSALAGGLSALVQRRRVQIPELS